MHEKEFHRLVVYYNYSGELIPYSDQTFKDNLIPDILISNSLIGLKLGKKYIISISDDNCTAIGIIKEFEANEWIRKEIIEVKKFNILLNNKNKTNNRICKIPPPDFMIIDPLKWDLVMSTINIGMYPLFTGPTGCGKTSLARAVATATGRDFFYLNCGGLQKPKSVLIGSMQAKDGSTFLVESEFMTYYKSDRPTLIFLDELSRISSQGANELMTITDREESYIYAPELGKRISKGKDVVFCAAANFGIQYSDTRKLDMALLNRFIPFHQNYLSSEDETKLLNMKVPNLNQLELASLIKQANLLRDNFDILQIEVSHRNMIDFARYMGAGFPFKVIQRELLINLFLNGSDDKRDVADQILNGKQI